jgi:hypothetical protein
MNNPQFTPWEKRALAALPNWNQAMERARDEARTFPAGPSADPDRTALNDRVLALMDDNPALTYSDALDQILNDL